MDVSPFPNFYSHDDPHRFRHVDDYSLKTNFARTTNFNHTYIYFNKNCSNVESDTLRY